MWSVRTVEVTGEEPVTLAEAKDQCHVDDTDSDAFLTRLIKVARERVEACTGLLLRAQTIEITLSGFIDPMRLPRAPISAVSSVEYGDVAVTGFRFGEILSVPTLRPALLSRWPYTRDDVVITASAGYADGEVPEELKHAILLMVADWFKNREPTTPDQQFDIAGSLDSLVNSYRLSWL